jgi:hypothetical protein
MLDQGASLVEGLECFFHLPPCPIVRCLPQQGIDAPELAPKNPDRPLARQ